MADDLLTRAKARFKLAKEADDKQAKREVEDLRFQVPENQWDEIAKNARRGDTSTPARPMLSISALDAPQQLVINQVRQAQLGINIHPVSEDADDDTAEVMQGIYRAIERECNANQARVWAVDRGSKAGRGWYRVNTCYDDATPETEDQKIVIERIYDQSRILIDPAAEKPDYSDAKYAFERVWMTPEDFREAYPDAKTQFTDDEFTVVETQTPEWVKGTEGKRAVLVVVYWYKAFGEPKVTGRKGGDYRETIVHRAVLSAMETLEDIVWNGKYIPLIPYTGKELQPFDGEKWHVGMIRPNRDAQKFRNYSASMVAERMQLEPRVPFIGAEGQFAGHEAEWKMANVRNLPYLEYRKVSLDGTPAPPPQRAQLDGTGMNLAMEGLRISQDWIQAGTGIYDPSLGKSDRHESGRKVQALQQQADAGNNHFLASLADTTLPYEARVVLDLIPKIYDRPGRVMQVLGEDPDDAKSVMLNQPFVMNQAGKPMPAQDGDEKALHYDLTKGTYAVSVSVGRSFQTKLQEGMTEIGAILQSDPSLMPIIGATYFRFLDFPGAKEIADILKQVRERQYPGLGMDKDKQPTPEQMMAQAQGMQQKLQEQGQQLQQASQALATDEAKQRAQIETAKINASKEIELQKMKDATAITVAQINASTKIQLMQSEAQNEAIALGHEHAFQDKQTQQGMAHEVASGDVAAQRAQQEMQAGQAHEASMAEADAGTQSALQGQAQEAQASQQAAQQEHEGTMQEQAAELAPEPTGGAE